MPCRIRLVGALFAFLPGLVHAIVCPPNPPTPPRPVPASLWVSSDLTPTGAKDRIRITVFDRYNGLTSTPYAAAQSVDSTRSDNAFTIAAVLLDPCVPANPEGPFDVDLGLLPAGRYAVSYSSDGINASLHAAKLRFDVAESGATRAWPPVPAIEYFHALLDRYFATADPPEIDALDAGIIRGWARTGESFPVYPPDAIPGGGNSYGVCRMYGLPQAGLDSHFYSLDAYECAQVLATWGAEWILEQSAAFGASLPFGGCAGVDQPCEYYCNSGEQPLFRLFSARPGADHRYTIRPEIRDAMLAAGWIVEGRFRQSDGSYFAMCVPR